MQVHPADFAEPPHNFIKSMLSKEIVEKNLADEFFSDSVSMVEEMGRVDGPSAGKIFHGKFWGGADESRKVFFRGIQGKRVHGIVTHRVYFKNCAELGNEYTFALAEAIGRQVKKSFRRGQGKVSDRLRAGIHTVRFKRSDGSEKHGYSVQNSGEHRRSVHVDT